MKYLLLLLAIPCLSASECGNKKSNAETEVVKDSIPSCVRQLIDKSLKEVPPNAPVQVEEYVYHAKTVYVFTAQCCDQYNVAYDDSCNMICAPSGGFSGRGDGKCPGFADSAKYVRIVWKNPAK
jgi:hypothetical protein